jgi:hypothetical protein
MRIEILERSTKSYEVRIIDAGGRMLRSFIYPTIESARIAANDGRWSSLMSAHTILTRCPKGTTRAGLLAS